MSDQRDFFRDNPPVPEAVPAPIDSGREHFSLYVYDEFGPWPEFIPGYHFGFRQPSRLRGMCSLGEPKTDKPEFRT